MLERIRSFPDGISRGPCVAAGSNFKLTHYPPAGNVIPWPTDLPEQISVVQAVLAGATRPLGPQDIARNFKGKRPATIRPLLDALAGLGMARRLSDGRYAA